MCLYIHFQRFSVERSQRQLAKAIQQAYNLDTPPELTIENIGIPTDSEAWESTTQVRW